MFKINYREPLAKEVSGSFYLKRTNSALNLHSLLSRLPAHILVKRIHRAGKLLIFQARKYFVCTAVGKDEHGTLCNRADFRLKVAELDDDDTRIYFPLRKGKTSGIISTNYRLPEPAAHRGENSGAGADCAVLELSTVGNPLERGELPLSDIELTLIRQ